MGEGTEQSPGAVAGLLHIIALSRLIYFRMKLLLGACVTVSTSITCLTITGFTPFLAVFNIRTWRTTIFIFPWRSTFILEI